MKAVGVFPAKKQVGVIDHPEPRIEKSSQVKLRMVDVGICGTDKEIVAFEYGEPPAGTDYLVIGHEAVGEVVAVGGSVTSLKAGDLVVPSVRRPCSHEECISCHAGRADFCYSGDFVERGIKGLHGYLAEFVVEDERFLVKVPAELKDEAVLIEPLTIAEKAIEQIWAVQDRLPWVREWHEGEKTGRGHQAVVLGAGPVGLLGAMALKNAGFDVYVYSKATHGDLREDVVKGIGAHFLHADDVPADYVVKELGHTLDVVYEAVGASQLAFDFLHALGPNGVFVFTGVPGRKGPINVDADKLMRNLVLRNQVALGTVNASRGSFEAAVKDLIAFKKRWPTPLSKIITNRIPIDRAMEALGGKLPGIKNVVRLH
jgi:threonine dehydrogenase-like Zn-dependent dehydrogenase